MAQALKLPHGVRLVSYSRAAAADLRDLLGRHGAGSLLTLPDANTKLAESSVYTLGLSLAPADASGWEVCPMRGECSGPCVSGYRAGLARATGGESSRIHRARIGRVRALAENPDLFLSGLLWQVERIARRIPAAVAVRLNVGSDLVWESAGGGEFVARMRAIRSGIGHRVRLYDYTKIPRRVGVGGYAAEGYRLCLSVSERSKPAELAAALDRGACVALVVSGLRHRLNAAQYRKLPVPSSVRIDGRWWPAVDGDRSDDRGTDPHGRVVVLRGKAGAERLGAGGCDVGGRFALRADSGALSYRGGVPVEVLEAARSPAVVASVRGYGLEVLQ